MIVAPAPNPESALKFALPMQAPSTAVSIRSLV